MFDANPFAPCRRLCRIIACAVFAVAAAAGISGCTSVNWKGDNFHDEFAHWGEGVRPAGEPGQRAGLSEQAQQVERNLGVR
jgi:hypothetical protein